MHSQRSRGIVCRVRVQTHMTKDMSEHHTQGRQGQGARHNRRYRTRSTRTNRSTRHNRHRMPRREEDPESGKPSLFKRILSFLGFGRKATPTESRKRKDHEKKPPLQRVRVAQPRTPRAEGGEPGAKRGRRRAASVPPTDQARLYVGNLSFETTESELEDLFKGFGHVRSVEVIYNSRTYRSKGYGFVEMMQLADARRAAEVLHGQMFMGRELMVSAASERTERTESQPKTEEQESAAPAEEQPAKEPAAQQEEAAEEQAVTDADFGEEVVMQLTPAAEAPAEAAPAPAEEAPAKDEPQA